MAKEVTGKEYDKLGKFSSSSLERRFGGWNKTLELANLGKSRISRYSNEELFENLENVWIKLGRQPRHSEMRQPLSPIYGSIYDKHFGKWQKALESFVEYANSENKIYEGIETTSKNSGTHKTQRTANLRLRFLVLHRDKFKCVKCGQSPATNPKIELEVDHIIPWTKGGETVPENLQSLCLACNQGKSNLHQI